MKIKLFFEQLFIFWGKTVHLRCFNNSFAVKGDKKQSRIIVVLLKKVYAQLSHSGISFSYLLTAWKPMQINESVPEQYRMQSTIWVVIKADVITLQTFPMGKAVQCWFFVYMLKRLYQYATGSYVVQNLSFAQMFGLQCSWQQLNASDWRHFISFWMPY